MTRLFWFVPCAAIIMLAACGKSDDQERVEAIAVADCDICGTWAMSKVPLSSSGPCSTVPPEAGEAVFEVNKDVYRLTISGIACSPDKACTFSGPKTDTGYVLTNAGSADNEGGSYANKLVLRIKNDSIATGTQISNYTMADETVCTWVTRLDLRKQ